MAFVIRLKNEASYACTLIWERVLHALATSAAKYLSDTELAAKAAKMSYSISVVGHMKHPLFSYLKME